MLKTFLLAVILITTNTYSQKHTTYIDSTLKPYVTDFIFDMLNNGIYPVKFRLLDSIITVPASRIICDDTTCIGCADYIRIVTQKYKNVLITSFNLNYTADSATYYKTLVYHELGHSVFDLGHYEAKMDIMNGGSWEGCYEPGNWSRLHDNYIKTLKRKIIINKNSTKKKSISNFTK